MPLPDDPAVGPKQVRRGLWLANLGGAKAANDDIAVISLCRPKGAFDHHPVRRELYLIDEEAGYNPALDHVLADLLTTVEALFAERREVLVHCWAGRSRTGLAFRAWLTHAEGRTFEDAQREASRLWPPTATYNTSFEHALGRLAR